MKTRSTQTLHDLPIGASGVVQQVTCDRSVSRRLMEMGVLPGTRVMVTRVAPLGDPLELRVRNFALSIRRAEARRIALVDVHPPPVSR